MAKHYKPKMPFDIAFKLWIPSSSMELGVKKKTFTEGPTFMASMRTYTSNKNDSDDVYTPYVSTIIDTWYNPLIKADCEVELLETGERYSIETEPENVEMRHQWMQLRIRKIGGRA
jgi:hypothetical protein